MSSPQEPFAGAPAPGVPDPTAPTAPPGYGAPYEQDATPRPPQDAYPPQQTYPPQHTYPPQQTYPPPTYQYGGMPSAHRPTPAAMWPNRASVGKRFGGLLLETLLVIVTLGIGWLIWSLIVWGQGQTPAKSLLGMRCVRTDTGQQATWGTMFVREFVGKSLLGNLTCGISTLVGAFMVFGENRQGVWDLIASTVVIDESLPA